ncbi:putative Receptor protein kinase [Melia azedarach]|uniref:Receptor protein kinase n=1 Tax=Melia azedarach TaxID=155640 RepID=A0ACC1YEN3_MELAZ|nr:putative Receptor protein kinase [Melia azedarach]
MPQTALQGQLFLEISHHKISYSVKNLFPNCLTLLYVSIPEGETHIKDVLRGTSGLIAPELLRNRGFNEKLDVYNFGLLLFQLLTGEKLLNLACRLEIDGDWMDFLQKYVEDNGFKGIVDPRIIGDEPLGQQQLRASSDLAFKCFSELEEDRPAMIDVAKQLRQMVSLL